MIADYKYNATDGDMVASRTQSSKDTPYLSIILVNWNTPTMTIDCIASIRESVKNIPYEIIVVDNGSTDDSVSRLSAIPNLILIRNSSNVGFACANNRAMMLARGKAFLLLNTDTLILGEAINYALDKLFSSNRTGMVGCRLLNADGTLQRSCSRFPDAFTPLIGRHFIAKLYGLIFRRSPCFSSAYLDSEHLHELSPEWIMGAFMLVRREAVAECGMLDEDFFMYQEDMDWCYRFQQNGWKIVFIPNVSIIHFGGASSRSVPEATIRRQIASTTLFLKKHQPDIIAIYLYCSLIGALVDAVTELALGISRGTTPPLTHSSRLRCKLLYQLVRSS